MVETAAQNVDYVARAERYVEDVLAGRRPANRLARLACERHRRDRARALDADAPYYLDERSANHAAAFVERCPHVKGKWATRRETLRLEGWQAFIVVSLFGWRWTRTNTRRYTTAYIEVPRKNGKSALGAPLLLYLYALDNEAGAECYSAATKMVQAKLVFDVAREMAKRSPDFLRRSGVKVEAHKILLERDGAAECRALEATKLDGLNVHGAIIDELHQHPTPEVYHAIDQGRGARLQSMLIAITTAGADIAGVCYQQHDYVRRILEEIVADESYFGVIYAADEGDDPFDETTWAKANPNLGVSKTLQYMRTQAEQARNAPPWRGAFLRKHLGVWTALGATALDLDGWRAGEDPTLTWAPFEGAGGTAGIDLARKGDLCACVARVPLDDGRFVLFARFHASEATVRAEGAEHLLGWAGDGRIEVHPGHLIDLDLVEADFREMVDYFGSEAIGYDPHYAAQMADRMAADGLPMIEHRQSPMNVDQPFQTLQGLVAEGRIVTDGDPVLRWMAANTLVKQHGEFQRPYRRRPEVDKIDGIAAAISAFWVAEMEAEAPPESIYEHRPMLEL